MSDQPDAISTPTRPWRLIAAGFIGNVLEWYDFAVYGFFAATIGTLFFPSGYSTLSLIAAFGAFAVGFLMRPIGAILFGHIGDRYGRRRLLIISALAMGLATFAIGLLPTYADIGVTAAVLMVGLRMIQGLSVGGEYVGSGVFLAERAPAGRRGFYAGFSTAGLVGGLLLGSVVGVLITDVLSPEQIAAWGWRLPFLAGLLLGGVALVLRLTIAAVPLPEAPSRAPVIEAVKRHGLRILHAAAIIVLLAASWYIAVIYLPTWMVRHLDMSRSLALLITTLSMAVALVVGCGAAALSDCVGRKPVLMILSGLLTLACYPALVLIGEGDVPVVAAAQGLLVVLNGCCAFVLPATLAEMFPWRVRTTSANLSLNLTFAIFGGTAPIAAVYLVAETGGLGAVGLYLSVLGVVSVIACAFLKDRRGEDL